MSAPRPTGISPVPAGRPGHRAGEPGDDRPGRNRKEETPARFPEQEDLPEEERSCLSRQVHLCPLGKRDDPRDERMASRSPARTSRLRGVGVGAPAHVFDRMPPLVPSGPGPAGPSGPGPDRTGPAPPPAAGDRQPEDRKGREYELLAVRHQGGISAYVLQHIGRKTHRHRAGTGTGPAAPRSGPARKGRKIFSRTHTRRTGRAPDRSSGLLEPLPGRFRGAGRAGQGLCSLVWGHMWTLTVTCGA